MVCTSLIPALRQRQADICKLEASLLYIGSSSNSNFFFVIHQKPPDLCAPAPAHVLCSGVYAFWTLSFGWKQPCGGGSWPLIWLTCLGVFKCLYPRAMSLAHTSHSIQAWNFHVVCQSIYTILHLCQQFAKVPVSRAPTKTYCSLS